MVEKYMMVEIWSDVVCPWCAIGRSRLDAALADFAHADAVEVVLRSFELDPGAPVGGSQPMVEVLAQKYGVPRDEAVRMMARTEGLAADEGLVMTMATTLHSNTLDAHRLLHLALATGGPDVQARLNAALVAAHFEHGDDVGDHAVLRRTAVAAGLAAAAVDDVLAGDGYADEVAADVRQARAYGATGVPFFVIDARYGISGAQPTEVFAQALEQAWSESVTA
jgi:predicted DsbA family dithiol-disulfide isomerase